MEYWVKLRKENSEYHTITRMSLVCFCFILLQQGSEKRVEIQSIPMEIRMAKMVEQGQAALQFNGICFVRGQEGKGAP